MVNVGNDPRFVMSTLPLITVTHLSCSYLKSRVTERSSSCWLTPPVSTRSGADQSQVSGTPWASPREKAGPRDLGHHLLLSQAHVQEVALEAGQLGLKPVLLYGMLQVTDYLPTAQQCQARLCIL